jgi:hypothetical protein
MLNKPAAYKGILRRQNSRPFLAEFLHTLLIDVSAARELWWMIRTRMGTHNRLEMVAVYGTPCTITPRNNKINSRKLSSTCVLRAEVTRRGIPEWGNDSLTRNHMPNPDGNPLWRHNLPDRRQTPPPHVDVSFDFTGVFRKCQILANGPEFLSYAFISKHAYHNWGILVLILTRNSVLFIWLSPDSTTDIYIIYLYIIY